METDERPADWYLEMVAERERLLVVGARVRIRLSECEWNKWAASHHPSINGSTATVGSRRQDDYHGHNIVVTLDNEPSGTWAFAPGELEPLTLNDIINEALDSLGVRTRY